MNKSPGALRLILLILACLLANSLIAADQRPVIVARCGELNGYAYYAERKMVPKAKAGWQRDGVRGGKVALVKDANGLLDIVYYDVLGDFRSTLAEGGDLFLIFSRADEISIGVRYPDGLDSYTFWADSNGRFQYALVQSKSPRAMTKQAVFVGTCSEVNFVEAVSSNQPKQKLR